MKYFLSKTFPSKLILSMLGFCFTFLALMTPAYATGVYDLPYLDPSQPTWVFDQAEVMSFTTEGKLNSTLQKLAENTGNEVHLVTIRRLDYGETIDSFTAKLFAKWFATPEAQANQTLLVLDTITNNAAIHTGDAVKAIMSDEIAQSVANDTVGVPLREGDKYNQAFLDASDRLVAVLSGKPDPGAPEVASKINIESTFTKAEDTDQGSATIWVVVLLILATVIPMVTYFFYVGFPGR